MVMKRKAETAWNEERSTCLGPMFGFLNGRAKCKTGDVLTILAGKHDDDAEVWESHAFTSSMYRVFYFKGGFYFIELLRFGLGS